MAISCTKVKKGSGRLAWDRVRVGVMVRVRVRVRS
tara:strand:- start:22 stop:126 length:105 start_codon:yes stop_codon:yes gene_type:complete